jgi:hypothetical protein
MDFYALTFFAVSLCRRESPSRSSIFAFSLSALRLRAAARVFRLSSSMRFMAIEFCEGDGIKMLFRIPLGLAFLQVLRIPIQITLQAVSQVARLGETVELFGIDDELSIDIQAAKGLIHLLRVE